MARQGATTIPGSHDALGFLIGTRTLGRDGGKPLTVTVRTRYMSSPFRRTPVAHVPQRAMRSSRGGWAAIAKCGARLLEPDFHDDDHGRTCRRCLAVEWMEAA